MCNNTNCFSTATDFEIKDPDRPVCEVIIKWISWTFSLGNRMWISLLLLLLLKTPALVEARLYSRCSDNSGKRTFYLDYRGRINLLYFALITTAFKAWLVRGWERKMCGKTFGLAGMRDLVRGNVRKVWGGSVTKFKSSYNGLCTLKDDSNMRVPYPRKHHAFLKLSLDLIFKL